VTNRNYSLTGSTPPNYQATPNVSYFYDGSNVSGGIANSKGKLTKVSSSVSTTEYTAFDILGRVTAHRQTTDGTAYTTGYNYNLSGALIEETYPSGRVVKNTLDTDGDLQQVQSRKANDTFRNYANAFTYTAAGAVSSVRLGNGRWENTVFNSRLQPTQIGLGSSASSQNLLKLNYSYNTSGNADNNGNILSQTITVPAVGATQGFTATQTYTYDSLNRLSSATETVSNNQTWKQTFTFDRFGNRNFDETNTTTLPKQCNGNTEVCATERKKLNPSVNSATNRLSTNDDYAYSSNGNMTGDAYGRVFKYDGENKQYEVRDSQNQIVGQYYFDGNGKRIKKVVPSTGETTVFVYDSSGKLTAEYSTNLSTTQQVSYTTADHLGSPRIKTNENGTTIARNDYHPYGEEISTSQRSQNLGYKPDDVRQKFTGHERDTEVDLDYAKARMYGNKWGRFTTIDPSSKSIDPISPQTWNRYSYCYNNPLTLIDENGKWPTSTHRKIIDRALTRMGDGFRESVKKGSRNTDWSATGCHTCREKNAPQHAMTPGSWVKKYGLDKAQEMAKEEASKFINKNLDEARRLWNMAQNTQPGSPAGVALLNKSLEAFGAAIHVIMDNVSPAHKGFQVYDNSTPAAAGAAVGAATTPTNPLLGALVGAGASVATSNLAHKEKEEPDPTGEEYNLMSDRIRALFKEIYGQAAYEESVLEKDRRETAERIRRNGVSSL